MYIFANCKNKWRKKRILIVIFSKKIMNNKIITLVLMGFLVFSCKKNQQIESINNIKKLSQNIKEYAEGEEKSTLELAIVKKISDKEILVVFDNKIENSEQNINLIRQTLLHLVGKIIWSSEENKKMFNDGVSFNIQVRDSKTKNIIITEVVNKTSINNNIIINTSEKHAKLQRMLEIFNNKLPLRDTVSGVVITKIYLGDKNNLVYDAVVPKNLQDAIQRPNANELIKEDMSKNQGLKNILADVKKYDVQSLEYKYQNENGKILQVVEVMEKDFK